MKHIKALLFVFLLVISQLVSGQNGKLCGRVTESNSEIPVPFALIIIYSGNEKVGSAISDIDGKYIIQSILPGKYSVKASYPIYKTFQVENVSVISESITNVNFNMIVTFSPQEEIIVKQFTEPLMGISVKPKYTEGSIIKLKKAMPFKINDSGVKKLENEFNYTGRQKDGTIIYIDG